MKSQNQKIVEVFEKYPKLAKNRDVTKFLRVYYLMHFQRYLPLNDECDNIESVLREYRRTQKTYNQKTHGHRIKKIREVGTTKKQRDRRN